MCSIRSTSPSEPGIESIFLIAPISNLFLSLKDPTYLRWMFEAWMARIDGVASESTEIELG